MSEKLSQSDIAEHLDMSPRNLRDVLTGLGLDWRTDSLDEIRIGYIRKLREAAAGRSDDQLAHARTRRELADARLKELDLAEKYKQIVSVEHLEPLLISLMKQIQSAVLEAGNKSLQMLETKYSIEVDDDDLLGILRSALGAVASGADQLVATVTGQPCASVSSAANGAGTVDRRKRKAAGGQ